MKLFLQLENGNQMQVYEYFMTPPGFCAKFVNVDPFKARDFFGREIVKTIDILDENKTLIESIELNMKYRSLNVEDTTITSTNYIVTKETYDETVYDTDGETILNVIAHPEEGEWIENKEQVEMTQIFLEKPTVEDEIDTIKNVVGIVNVATLPLPDLKEYQIKQSKILLEKYIAEHPLKSSCHNNTEATYNISLEKQMMMANNLKGYEVDVEINPSAILTWNESGDVCEEWTLDEFKTLISEARRVVLPLQSAQQKYEMEILNQTSITDLRAMTFNYSEADIRNAKDI